MINVGFYSLFDMEILLVMGFVEVFFYLFVILKVKKQFFVYFE